MNTALEYLKTTNAEYIDELYSKYLNDPYSVDDSWRYFFDGIGFGAEALFSETQNHAEESNGHYTNGHSTAAAAPTLSTANAPAVQSELRVADLIYRFRHLGHQAAYLDPLSPAPAGVMALEPSQLGLTESDLDKKFYAAKLAGMEGATLREVIAKLKQTYCQTVGIEFTHIQDAEIRNWVEQKLEVQNLLAQNLDAETKKYILKRLSEVDLFERFLHTRYVAQKRFSIEGGDSLIPALDCIIEKAGMMGAKECVLGMAHRGRLNVLTHIMGKKPEYLFSEFEGKYAIDPNDGEGDVKYHKGYSKDHTTRQGKSMHLSLAFNPSHLEFVNPVVEGMARAKQDQLNDTLREQVIPILIHGDAAFAGQGVCYETINMSRLQSYSTGGTIHYIVNNQVGFTTPVTDSRSTRYASDLAKMLEVPIFHVNGDDAEAVWKVSQLAFEFRMQFKRDVLIDIICYRRHGHNEGDEPTFTQPVMYGKIKNHPTPRQVYGTKLIKESVISENDFSALEENLNSAFLQAQGKAKSENPAPKISKFDGHWKGFKHATEAEVFARVKTELSAADLTKLADQLCTVPSDFKLHSKLTRFFEGRKKAVQDGKGIDWGGGESLAFGSLIAEGTRVRITGQDAERGTFTHRHAVVNDSENGKKYCAYRNLNPLKGVQKPGIFEVYNSNLSETAVMGFEYGYALSEPNALVIWEAQFGDFANGAQVIIDQFLATSESKWQRMCGLVLLLPHSYEGQGPEHSSARLERFLQLCGKMNMTVGNFTTPAQLFHALRRQVKRNFRKPLIVMSPKSVLRNPLAVSDLSEFTDQGFQEVIPDLLLSGPAQKKVRRVILCTGKVYYDLLAERNKLGSDDVALVRVEQLYPFPKGQLETTLKLYPAAKEVCWLQEEPKNMGAWIHVFGQWTGALCSDGLGLWQKFQKLDFNYIGRDVCASPAVGSPKIHEAEQKAILEKAFEK